MTTTVAFCLASLFAAWNFFGGGEKVPVVPESPTVVTAKAEMAQAAAAAKTDTDAVIRAAVSNAVSQAVHEAVVSAADKAAKAAAAEKAAREEKEAAEKAARAEAKADAQEARAIAKEDRERAEKAAADKKAEKLEELRRIESHIFKLEHASAMEVAEKFNTMWSGDFGINWKISKMAVAFPESNSIMMTAPRAIIMACEQSLKELDVEAPQVYIEARFVELGNTASHKVGIDWSLLGGMTGTATLGGGIQSTTVGSGVNEYTRALSGKNESTTYKVSGDNDTDGSVTYFNGTLNFSQMSLTLKALDATEDAKTFSNPKIIVSSGKKATVDMTTKYPNVQVAAKKTFNTSGESVDLDMKMAAIPGEDKMLFAKESFFSWGISLDVVPRIGTNGLINVSIVPTISSLSEMNGGFVTAESSDASESSYSSKYPIIEVQRLITEFNMESGSTAVIGGLSVTMEKQVDNGIPLLREIPWLGPRLFGSMERVKEQKEIIVFVTVGLVNPRNMKPDAGLPKNAVLGRQYTQGQKLEPGDREQKSMEGFSSLDMRPLEEQERDPLKKQKFEGEAFFQKFNPFTKDPNYKKEK